ncbi:phosphoglycerate dehydrogenase [Elongatibacter sediminis]|uniref:D-3-phosphoglycerate dehydrogenase n=1 Tax=Elongatibacter sediminis TaxID=3119006 RepID=A0AAW9RF95_9GAMM
MFRIRTHNRIAERGLEQFPRDFYAVGPEVEEPDALLLRSHRLHDEALPDSVVAVARAGAGVNNIPVDDYSRRGIVVFNTPGANANAVKELVAAGLFLGSRDIVGGFNFVQSLKNIDQPNELAKVLEAEKKRFSGTEVAGKTLGVVGLGAIGSLVANMALELGMRVAGYDPAISVEAAWRLSSRVEKMDSLEALLSASDFVSLHVPAIEQTRHLINAETLARLRSGARLLNFAREEIVDAGAVTAALDSGHLGAYVTDFPLPGLLGRDNVIVLPHIGASTREAEENCSVMAVQQLMDFLQHGNIRNSVNFPATRMARDGAFRITFSNDNVPRVLGSVLSVLADSNLNVLDMVNRSRGDLAYNIIDVETAPESGVLKAIAGVEGVIRVRTV